MSTRSVAVLLIEDDPDDAALIRRYLTSGGIDWMVVRRERLSDGLAGLSQQVFDVILLDLGLPDGPGGIGAFEAVFSRASGVPIIVLTGNDDDRLAIEAVKKGAQDYLVKDHVTRSLLSRAILYAIERRKLIVRLEQTLKEIRTLRGFLPICSNCKKIRDDKGYWTQIETYISSHSDAEFSHGLCPECADKLYPGLHLNNEGRE